MRPLRPRCQRVLKVRTCGAKFAVRVERAKVAVWKDFGKRCNLPRHCRHPTRCDCAVGNRGAKGGRERGRGCVENTIENAAARIYVEVNQKFWSGVGFGEVRSIAAVGEQQEQRTTREAQLRRERNATEKIEWQTEIPLDRVLLDLQKIDANAIFCQK